MWNFFKKKKKELDFSERFLAGIPTLMYVEKIDSTQHKMLSWEKTYAYYVGGDVYIQDSNKKSTTYNNYKVVDRVSMIKDKIHIVCSNGYYVMSEAK